MSWVPGAAPLVVRMLGPDLRPTAVAALTLLRESAVRGSRAMWSVFVLFDLAAPLHEPPVGTALARLDEERGAWELGEFAVRGDSNGIDLTRRLLVGVADALRARGADRLIALAGVTDAARAGPLGEAGFRQVPERQGSLPLSPPGLRWLVLDL
jgi:hypothetical protein